MYFNIRMYIRAEAKGNTYNVYALEKRCDDDLSVDYYKEVIHWVGGESLLKEEVAAYINAYDMFYL